MKKLFLIFALCFVAVHSIAPTVTSRMNFSGPGVLAHNDAVQSTSLQ